MRKTYGNTWWGKEWLNALSQIDYSNRLPRGRTYANKGLVGDIKITGNKITSSVKGSRYKPYQVSITIPRFSAQQKIQIIQMVTSNPALLSKLLNRYLPSQLNKTCERAGINIFPSSWNDMRGNCSCPDWAVPCKHIAATLYLIANEIDKNPFIVFQLHDFDLFKGLEGVGYSLEGQQETHITKSSELMRPFSFDEEKFVWQKDIYKDLDFSKIPNCKEQLLTILTEQTVFFPLGKFKTVLEKAYTSVARSMLKRIKKDSDTDLSSAMDATDEIELLLDSEFDFLTCNFRNNKDKLIMHLDNEEDLIECLEMIPTSRLDTLAPEVRALFLTFRLAEKLVIQSACIPQLIKLGTKHYRIRWLAALVNEEVKNVFEKLQALTPPNILYYKKGKDIYQPSDGNVYLSLLSFFISYFFNSSHNLKGKINETEVGRLFFNGSIEHFATFESKEYPMAIQLWLNKFYIVNKQYIPIVQVTDSEAGFQVEVLIENTKKTKDSLVTLPQLFKEDSYTPIRLPILRDLAMLSDYFPQIDLLLATKGKEKLFFDAKTFVHILFKILPSIQLFGIKILLPKALRKLIRPQVSMMLESKESGVVANSSLISLDNMLSFQWQIAIGDQLMNRRDFLKLVKQFSGIVKLNDQYVFFDEKEIKNLLDKLESPPELDSHQILKVALTEEYEGAKVSLDHKTQQLIDGLLKGEKTKIPKKLKAKLRPYQQRGYEWLYKNTRVGFGSVIADDMGLGKTLQVIATLLKLKEDGEFQQQKALIIVPTTLLTNWEKEIQKFAPSLDTHVYHGSNRNLKPLADAQILITTYGVIRSEGAKLQKLKWLVIVIDEAQNIKNPGTAQTKAVKKIKAPVKIAMTGTPVENRLTEYWSIFDFSNKGYLGNLKKFKEKYARPIEVDRDQSKLERFRNITAPFILRRLKSDKSIIKDLPDKIEKDQYCQLTKEQTAIYQNVIDSTMKSISEAEGINRKGLVLKLITALKQVCNHPKQFLKKGNVNPNVSGKTVLLLDLVQQMLDNNEKILIFTQYREMGNILIEIMEKAFRFTAPFLHGGVSRKKRDEMVDDFQNNRSTRVLILSLKAGGTGLNLTAASNVIHYDLWWNPAVEAQATDRAYRIGQKNNVMVHRFITKNTFEEKINQLLQNKKELAELTVSTGEKWIGDFTDQELKDLVKLGG